MCINFKDKKGRNIQLEENNCIITAYHQGKRVGEFVYEEINISGGGYEEDKYLYELNSMNIYDGYRKSGIGTKIIEFGKEIFRNVTYPKDTGSRHENHLSNEGAAFISSCLENGIISKQEYFHGYDED